MTKKYADHFERSNFDPKEMIKEWNVNSNDVEYWVNVKNAAMIFVPVINQKISKTDFYCSFCKQWLKITESYRNIKRHIQVHNPDFENSDGDKNIILEDEKLFSKKQEKIIAKNIILFILLRTQTFQYVEDKYLTELSSELPNRNGITKILEKISDITMQEIKSILLFSSSNSITFDGWSSKNGLPFLGITIRSLINYKFNDFFLDLIELNSETAINISQKISNSLANYGLKLTNIISCTTDNCPTMQAVAKDLNLWRIPCVCHQLNLVFKEFIENCSDILKPFFDLLSSLSKSNKYTVWTKSEKVKKIPSYVNIRWTSFCDTVLTFLDTKESLLEFCSLNQIESPTVKEWKNLSLLRNLCTEYKRIIEFFESDSFGASGFFLCYVDIINDKLIELDKTVFKTAAKSAKQKIKNLQSEYPQFWKTIAPIALLLNPCIPYEKLLTEDEIQKAKNAIEKRIKNYLPKQQKSDTPEQTQPDFMRKYFEDNQSENNTTCLDLVLKNRNLNHSPESLFHFWHEKVETTDKELAYVAFDILSIVITSVASERSFSRGRLIINDQRTRITSDHAKQQMIVQINKDTAEKALSRINVYDLISKS